jgi:hypothetical protein
MVEESIPSPTTRAQLCFSCCLPRVCLTASLVLESTQGTTAESSAASTARLVRVRRGRALQETVQTFCLYVAGAKALRWLDRYPDGTEDDAELLFTSYGQEAGHRRTTLGSIPKVCGKVHEASLKQPSSKCPSVSARLASDPEFLHLHGPTPLTQVVGFSVWRPLAAQFVRRTAARTNQYCGMIAFMRHLSRYPPHPLHRTGPGSGFQRAAGLDGSREAALARPLERQTSRRCLAFLPSVV